MASDISVTDTVPKNRIMAMIQQYYRTLDSLKKELQESIELKTQISKCNLQLEIN